MKAYPIQKLSEVMGGKLIAGNGAQQVESGVARYLPETAPDLEPHRAQRSWARGRDYLP